METNKWSWWEILLWAYSTIYISFFLFVFILNTFYPEGPNTSDVSSAVNVVFLLLTIPVMIFLVKEGIKHIK